MARSDSATATDAPTATDTSDGMRLVARKYDSTDDDARVVETETYTRREWWEDGPAHREAWATLARQQTDNLDVRGRDDEELVLIGVMGYYVTDKRDWRNILDMGGFNGREWTFATVTPVEAVDGEVGHPDDPPAEEWAHDPRYDGTRRSLSFPRVLGEVGDGPRTRSKWYRKKWGYNYPKAADLVVIHVEGEPSALDRESLTHALGYPEDDDGGRDRSGEWSFDRMVAAHRERLEAEQARQQHTFDTAERMDDLIDAVKADGVDSDEAAAVAGGAALRGLNDGRRVIRNELDDVTTVDDIDPVTEDAIFTGAAAAVKQLLAAVDDEDADTLVALLTDDDGGDGDGGEGSDE